jgi:GNAT superfamily N-acetyltransferase
MKLTANGLEIDVLPGTVEDVPQLLEFIRRMAEFEKLEVPATEETLRESLFGPRPAAHTFLAHVGGKPVAYGVYFFTFSTMTGKRGLWLEDLFVDREFRGRGIGKALMAYLAHVALENDCGRFEWVVLDWNRPAIEFYQRLGATVLDEWKMCRLGQESLSGVAGLVSMTER